jgi:hypothetical protein
VSGIHSPTGFELDEPPKRVGVLAAQTPSHLELLFASLERVFPVSFEHTAHRDFDGIAAVLVLDHARLAEVPLHLPRLVLPAGVQGSGEMTRGELATIVLADDELLARPLRGRSMPESAAIGESRLFSRPPHGRVLASANHEPVWWHLGSAEERLEVCAYPLAELHHGETLRDHLRAGRFMGLLPLVHFLRQILGANGWALPPLRASFVIDDPNLHRPSYGFLKYRALIDHATQHGYHVGFATVPLDGWLVNSRAAALVRENPVLSLLMHGNDHTSRELGRLSNDADAETTIAQALRRIAVLERRSGVSVERVMAPPHGACSEPALRAMLRLGLEAACISRPHPWRDGLPAPTPVTGWHPAEMVGGGLPILPRYSLSSPREDLVFRALLGQPLVLYGHHGDFSEGLDLFAEAAGYVNGLGDVRWGPLSEIARRNYATRRVEEVLHVWMHARRIAIEVPEGVRALRLQVLEPLGGAAAHRLAYQAGPIDMAFEADLGRAQLAPIEAPVTVELTLNADRPLTPADVAAPAFKPWPSIRRIAVEARDRIQPLL